MRGYPTSSHNLFRNYLSNTFTIIYMVWSADVGKSALRKQFTAQEDDTHFETDNTRFTILDVDRQVIPLVTWYNITINMYILRIICKN